MNGRFHNVTTFLSYVYLLRVPVLIGLALMALPPIALYSPLSSLLKNLFVLTLGNIFWAMIIALVLAWSLVVVSRVVLLNGRDRFGIDQWMTQDIFRGSYLFWGALPTLSLFACACVEKARELAPIPSWKWLGAAFGGALIAYVAGFFGLVLSVTLAPHYKHPADERFDIPFPFSKRILRWADQFRLIPWADPNWFARWALVHLPPDLRNGYLDHPDPHVDPPYEGGHLYPGHWLVLTMLLISSLVYWGVGFYKQARLGAESNVPAIAYVLILMLVANLLLSMLAFFLDRYRVPLLVPILLICTLGGQFPQSDHYFALANGISIPAASPADALAGHKHPLQENSNGGVIVVATAGGGIQAAAWTARVLTGLQERCSTEPGGNFADSIAAISAVSGGAVGAMFFVNKYESRGPAPGFHASAPQLKGIISQAETPALSEVAWAVAYVEPFRIFFPYLIIFERQKTLDRGFVLEQTWRKAGSVNASLSEWRDGVARGFRPAVIFNSTFAETGQPFLMTTTDFDTGGPTPARQTLAQKYPKRDLPVVTASRLAASFPYVSPATRALTDKFEYHLVDGGYYDNFGVDSLAAWLNQALEKIGDHKRPHVLVIEIRSFPSDAIPPAASKGWFYQSYAPLNGLMSVRTTAQLVRDREELALLRDKWFAKDGVRIASAIFEFPRQDAPLSWELTENQKSDIEAEWQKIPEDQDKKKHLQAVLSFCTPGATQPTVTTNEPR